MVLSDSPVAEYKTPDYLYGSTIPFIHSLKSSAYKCQAFCPAVEQPNILTGQPAAGTAVLSLLSMGSGKNVMVILGLFSHRKTQILK